jgi:hypothetical protein
LRPRTTFWPNAKSRTTEFKIRDITPGVANMIGAAVAKGQKRSNREAKKPKKTAAERLKATQTATDRQIVRMGDKDASRKR